MRPIARPLLVTALALAAYNPTLAGTISIPDGGQAANLQEDTRPLGFARSRGQTFVVPSPTTEFVITDFTFFVDAGTSPSGVNAAAYLYEFDSGSTSPTGSALYSSAPLTIVGDGALSFSGFSIALDPAKVYIAFLSTSGLQDEDNNSAFLESNQSNPYSDGIGFNYTGILTDTSSFTGDPTNWNPVTPNWDFRFDATFIAPEPSSALLSLGGLLLAARRRRS